MKLKEYIDKHSSQDALAKVLGVTQGAVSHWVTGRNLVNPVMVLRVEAATNGMVTRYDLRPDVFGSAPGRQQAA